MTIQDIKGRLAAATPGPWHVEEEIEDGIGGDETIWRGMYSSNGGLNKGENYELFSKSDAEFIAHAPEDIQYLLDELEKAHKNLDVLIP